MERLYSSVPVLAMTALALGIAGCQSSRLPYMGSRTQQVAPLPPAPAGNVAASELPPPNFPQAPAPNTATPAPVDMAAIESTATELTKNSVLGSWRADASGVNCQMFLTLTKYGENSRGGTRGCPGELASMRGWNVAGSQLQIFDENGSRIATLYSTGGERFNGQTAGGQAIGLSR